MTTSFVVSLREKSRVYLATSSTGCWASVWEQQGLVIGAEEPGFGVTARLEGRILLFLGRLKSWWQSSLVT